MPFSEKVEENNLSIETLFGKKVEVHSSQRNSLLHSLTESKRCFCWLQLEEDDHDPGRFWLKFIASLRQHFPNSGKDILNSLIDHHSQPIGFTMNKLSQELQVHPITIIFENIDNVDQQKWWQQDVNTWLNENEGITWTGLTVPPPDCQVSDSLSEETLPFRSRYSQESAEWLNEQGELLELLRLYLLEKEFELAGDLLEQHGEAWFHQDIDSLELLFWLREIPSVLLTARPVLCWLAALACKQLELTFLVNYYINAAENSLASFTRFSRVQSDWLQIELNDAGLTIGWLIQKLERLKL